MKALDSNRIARLFSDDSYCPPRFRAAYDWASACSQMYRCQATAEIASYRLTCHLYKDGSESLTILRLGGK